MKNLTSIEFIKQFNSVISGLKDSPVMICDQGTEGVVLMSVADYSELKKLEDNLYEKSAELAIQEGFVSDRDADHLLDSL